MSPRTPLRTAAAGTIIATLAILVLAADQFTKYLAIENLPPGEPVQIFGDFLIFLLVRNPGAAFSLGAEVTWIFTIALAVVVIVVAALVRRVKSRRWAVVLGLLLGGVLGNLTDRLFRDPGFPMGHVVDMISMPWMMPAIFNIADIFIVTGMISVALLVVFGLRFDGTRERDHAPVETDEEAEAAAAEDAEAKLDADHSQTGGSASDTPTAASDGR